MQKKNAPAVADQSALNQCADQAPGNHKPPLVSGQAAEVLNILRAHKALNRPVLSFHLTADCAIPEAASRILELRAMGFKIISDIQPSVMYRGRERRRVAMYSLGTPEWSRPGISTELMEVEA
ncbi:helix-turn-helix domain-containing protein [Chitinibacter sp. FCG-7]|uniref:Helix-turn-helix domain-containing protein n=1 Tax=Chitinibacter mangrovi TaxID=3153927 RepID=A0AAU7F772_9NEIS